jgi:hypothetical protein
LQVLLRDMVKPMSLSTALTFRRVAAREVLWEHPDIASWPEKDRQLALKRQFDLAGDRSPRVARIEVRLDDIPPQLVLHAEIEREFTVSIAPDGDHLTLASWWRSGEDRTVHVHPVFWSAALRELVALFDGKSKLLTRQGTVIDNLFPVTWG